MSTVGPRAWSRVLALGVVLSLLPVAASGVGQPAGAVAGAPALVEGAVTTAAAVPARFTFTGSGWGHGIGMSQYGAYGQALEGRSSTQILEHYYTPARVTTRSGNPTIDVQVLNERPTVTISAPSGTMTLIHGKTHITTTSVAFRVEGSQIVGKVANGTDYRITSALVIRWAGSYESNAGTATVVSVPYAHDNRAAVRYRHGELRVGVFDGKPNVINRVRLNDHYLYGLAEMPSSWPPAALQAQAIAGRTYALRKLDAGIRSVCGCHIRDETNDQKFTAWNKENEGTGAVWGKKWVAAVDATITSSGSRVLTHNGSLIQAYYSSSTGGKTTTNAEAWGSTALPYLQTRDDHWSKISANTYASWTDTMTQAEVAAKFELPDVMRLTVTRRAASGAVMQVRATSSAGQVKDLVPSPRSDTVRTKLGLRSAYFQIGSVITVERLSGSDRHATAVALGEAAYPPDTSGPNVVIVNGLQDSVVDGLVAAPFARSKDAPVFLATRTEVPAVTMAALERRDATTVWLIGGTGVLGPRVVDQLEDAGMTVHRIAGDDRFATAAAVARAMGSTDRAFFASGAPANLIDSAAVSGVAAARGAPILLMTRDSAPPATRDAVADLGVRSGWIVGGSGAISQAARHELTGVSTTRLSGSDRYSTAVAVAEAFAASVGTATVLLAGGSDAQLIDSLAGGVLGHVTLLTGATAPTVTASWFASNAVTLIRVAGGEGAVPQRAVDQLSHSMS